MSSAPPPSSADAARQGESSRFTVAFVCTGNICRSPMAEVVFRDLVGQAGLEGRIAVVSSGTGSWHVGGPADPRAIAALRTTGRDGLAHRASQFADFAGLDLILALDRSHLKHLRAIAPDDEARGRIRLLREFDPEPGDHEVPDPYYDDDARFAEVLAMIERSCAGLLESVAHTIGANAR